MKRPRTGERGAALLAVLLLVAVTGAIAAAAVEGLRLSRTIAVNATARDQGRLFADGAEQLAMLAIDDRIAQSPERTDLTGDWNGATRRVVLPGGGIAQIRVRDGGNCFNVNSVADGRPGEPLTRRPSGVLQFTGLMMALEVAQQDAVRIAEAAADWVDSDTLPGPGGAEDETYAAAPAPYRAGNTLFADPGELRALAGMTPAIYARLAPWLCALPTTDLSPININTLGLDQAPLLAMLAPGQLDVPRARRVLAQRPSNGWGNQVEFWRLETMSELNVPLDVQLQPQLKTNWFTLDVRVQLMGGEYSETVLVDSRLQPSRIVARRWGE
ncbi:MAG TPA: type II secretion system minor pseudopilin GspK [Allosphingosinicella sp.]|jgi:general secretion pathway protein K|nr:type II secretion system minor pseudopilin GspK [Allosphingosinicella sp.]